MRHGGARASCTRSTFAPSPTPNGDGFGDLQGVIDRLDHLEWLGVDGIWLSPVTPSQDKDWGYDVSDYGDVHPELGDLATLDRLVSEAASRGIRVILDLVPNHTSDLHPWFVDARSSVDAEHRGWYVWRDPRPDGSPPNNWVSVFGGPAWELDERTGQYYLHNFLVEQPDLDWWNEDVRRGFEEILRFWFDRGIAGFRIDVANGLIKDRALRDNHPATEDDPEEVRRRGQRQVHNLNRPEVHEIYRDWRRIADAFDPPRILVGETWIFDLREVARFYGETGDELQPVLQLPIHLRRPGRRDPARDRGDDRGRPRAVRPAGVGRLEPRRRAVPDAMVRRPSRCGQVRPHDPADAPGDTVPLLRRRDRDGRGAGQRRRCTR